MTNCDDQSIDDSNKVSTPEGFWFSNQINHYLIQVMAVFSELYVKTGKRHDGKEHFIHANVQYGSRDRVASSILTDHTQNKPIKLPAISVYKVGMEYASNRVKGRGTVDRRAFLPEGSVFPDDITVQERLMPVPYDLYVEVAIHSSNTLQQHQLLEQITMLFDPILQIQKNDNPEDWESLTLIQLEQIMFEENYPPGPERRIIVTPLQFRVPIWISCPKGFKNNFVDKLKLQLGTLPESYDIETPLEDLINDSAVDIREILVGENNTHDEGPFDQE